MLAMFLETTAALISNLTSNLWYGSLMPGLDGGIGSLIAAIGLS